MQKIPFKIEMIAVQQIDSPALTDSERNALIAYDCAAQLAGLFKLFTFVTFHQADQTDFKDHFSMMNALSNVSRLGYSISNKLIECLEEMEDLTQNQIKDKTN